MFNTRPQSHWSPFKIPPTPTIPSGSTDSYNLTCGAGADGEKNPSQFLKWKKTGLPEGELGDILYHDGESWVVLNPPSSSTVHVLASSGNAPYWLATEECD